MKSVANELSAESIAVMKAMTPDARVRLAFELGERDLAFFMAANGIANRAEAIRRLQRIRNVGRRPSCASGT